MSDDATVVDPDGHRVTFENEVVRVVEVRAATGSHIPMHSHPPRVIIAVGAYRLKSIDPEGNARILDRRPGQVFWSDHEEHEADVLVGPVHTIEIEVKSATTSLRPGRLRP